MPMLGNVDPYDDTRFSRMQVAVIIYELRNLVETWQGDVVNAAEELPALAQIVFVKPHRYLIFNGD